MTTMRAGLALLPIAVAARAAAAGCPADEKTIAALADPRALEACAEEALRAGRKGGDDARALFAAALAREEVNEYQSWKKKFFPAAVDERMGDFAASRAKWEAGIAKDPLMTYLALGLLSRDPEREKLAEKVVAFVRQAADVARAGGKAPIYVTGKGEARDLVAVQPKDLEAAITNGTELKYAFIDTLDLEKKTVDKHFSCRRCVIGKIRMSGVTMPAGMDFQGFVLGDAIFGRRWLGEVNQSESILPGKFGSFDAREAVFLGSVNLDGADMGRLGNFAFASFDAGIDARNLRAPGICDFRYARFGADANFRGAVLEGSAYFGQTLWEGAADFGKLEVRNRPWFVNSARFRGPVTVEKALLAGGVTFEDADFAGDLTIRSSRIGARWSLSRARLGGRTQVLESETGDIDALGLRATGPVIFADDIVHGNVALGLDAETRRRHAADPAPLARRYKWYQGDEDAPKDLTSGSQYGVVSVADLVTRFESDVSFANTIFQNFVNADGTIFGTQQRPGVADFWNTQWKGEAHLERTTFHGRADFTTSFAAELNLNEALFQGDVVIDDANVPGRLNLGGARFGAKATISFYNTNVAWFGIDRAQIDADGGRRLFYERCLRGDAKALAADRRLAEPIAAAVKDGADPEDAVRDACYERLTDEWVALKDSFSSRAMFDEEDWAYWNLKHFETAWAAASAAWYATPFVYLKWALFEKAFGWGVALENLAVTLVVFAFIAMLLFKTVAGDGTIETNGELKKLRDVPIKDLLIHSFISMIGTETGAEEKNANFRYKVVYVCVALCGVIIATFFIAAYGRMLLR